MVVLGRRWRGFQPVCCLHRALQRNRPLVFRWFLTSAKYWQIEVQDNKHSSGELECKLLLENLFCESPRTVCHQLWIFLTTVESSNLDLKPVESPFFLPLSFWWIPSLLPLQSPVQKQHLHWIWNIKINLWIKYPGLRQTSKTCLSTVKCH